MGLMQDPSSMGSMQGPFPWALCRIQVPLAYAGSSFHLAVWGPCRLKANILEDEGKIDKGVGAEPPGIWIHMDRVGWSLFAFLGGTGCGG